MVPNSMKFKAASALIAVGVALLLANWYAKPEGALAWTAALATFAVMAAVLRVSRRAVRHLTGEATAVRTLNSITTAVVFAGVMMGISLALALARSYGLIDGSDVARRSVGVLTGALIVMLGMSRPYGRVAGSRRS